MEMNRTELAAVNGVACDLLDAQGRLVVSPNALTLDGQRNVPADLQPGESLAVFLERHVPGIASGAWTVSIGGATVPQAMWARTFPKHGQLIACRAVLRKDAVRLVAIAALAFFAPQVALSLGMSGFAAAAVTMGVTMAGSLLINKVLGPKVPKPGEAAAARQVYSLSGQRNSARAYEPLPVLWGEMRVTPDLAGQPYTWFEGDDQYLSTILLGGVNVHSAADLSIGDTPFTSFADETAFYDGFSGMPSQDVPLYGNADSIAGGELENDGPWVTRTSSAGTITLQVDLEGQLYDMDGKGNPGVNSVPLFIETRPVGGGAWQLAHGSTLSNATLDVVRRTFTVPVALGQHEVRVRLGQPYFNEDDGKDACKFTWNVLKSIQPDTTDYSQWGRIGIKIKATGQISGSLDTLRATYRAKPLPVWNGTEWVTATTRAEGLSNPGAILLQTLRGVYADGVLQFGFGMSDEQIDIEGLKAFMLHCAARGYTYDRWITSSMSLGQFCEEVALAGMGEFSWTDGSRPTAVFVSSGQPLSGVVNMANMLKGSFSVAYSLANAADGIEYQYLDRDRNWETQTLRVAAPGVTTMLNPARITGEGVTTEAHAAVLARYHLAQSLYQYKTIDFGADIEHLAYRRLSVLSISHDLTQWGFGGRVMAAGLNAAGKVELQLDEPVPPMPQAYVGVRVPGARDYRVFKVEALESESEWITLVEPWPEDLDFPGEDQDNPAWDTLWCYDFKATPGYRVRVVGMQPEADLKGAQVSCVPEGPEFWDYVLNGNYVPAPNQSSLVLGRPKVSNLRITEKVNVQGDTEWYSLSLTWDVEGDYDHAQVWAGRDGSELRLVDGNAVGSRSEFPIDGAGEWLIEVRPFNASGLVGQSATVLYITSKTQLPPRNVDDFVVQEVAGGLRRFAWQYVSDRPPAFAGVQIRYLPGDVVLSVADWDRMQPLGEAGDVYRAQFETTRPQAGLWTFGCRAIDTAGQLANGIVRFSANLGDSFEEVQQPDPTPPPDVSGLAATPMFSNVMVEWNVADYTQGHGHARTIVYAAQGTGSTFAQAQPVAEAFAGPVSFASEPATTWNIWAKHQTVDGALSPNAAGPVNVTTAQDMEKVREAFAGQITESQLHQSLGQRIELIDGVGAGSVNQRLQMQATDTNAKLLAEAAEREARFTQEAIIRNRDLLAEKQARAAADQLEAQTRASALAQQTLDLGNAVGSLTQSILSGDGALSQRIDTVSATNYSRPNMLPGFDSWDLGGQFEIRKDVWGEALYTFFGGTAVSASPRIPAQEGVGYILTFDSLFYAQGGSVYMDIQFYNANSTLLADGGQVMRYDRHDFREDDQNRLTNTWYQVAPPGTAFMIVRAVIEGGIDVTAVGWRQPKLERGSLPATRYTEEATTTVVTALVRQEQTARVDAVSAEAVKREELAVQMRGNYTGNDLGGVTSGLVSQEAAARVAADNALAYALSMVSAGVGEQFDFAEIWYFDTDGNPEGWQGRGPLIVSGGFMRLPDSTGWANVVSPGNLGVNANTYRQVKMRIRKHGNPAWRGVMMWKSSPGDEFDGTRSMTIPEPDYDATGFAVVTWDPEWYGNVYQLNFDVYQEQTPSGWFEMDWVAMGRASPGASVGMVVEEQVARATAIDAEAQTRQALSVALTGLANPAGVTLAQLASGLLAEERNARVGADSAEVTARQNLATTVSQGLQNADAALQAEQGARSAGDEAEARNRLALRAELYSRRNMVPDVFEWTAPPGWQITNVADWGVVAFCSDPSNIPPVGNVTGPAVYVQPNTPYTISGDTLLTSSGGFIAFDLIFRDANGNTLLDGPEKIRGGNHDFSADGSGRKLSEVSVVSPAGAVTAEPRFWWGDVTSPVNIGFRQPKVERGGLPSTPYSTEAETQTLNANIVEESYARVQGDAAEAYARQQLQADYDNNNVNIYGKIDNEQKARADADNALAQSISTLTAGVQTRPNLQFNGGFEFGLDDWTGSLAGWYIEDGAWGRSIANRSIYGTGTLYGRAISAMPGWGYSASCDTRLYAGSGKVSIDLQFFNTQGQLLKDGTNKVRFATHDFSADNTGRRAIEVFDVAPEGASYLTARLVWEELDGLTVVGFRQIKVELGGLPSTAYTSELSLIGTVSAIREESRVRSEADVTEAYQRTQLAGTVETNRGNLQSAINNEAQARADGDSAEAYQRNQLASTVETNRGNLQGAINTEAQTRSDADNAAASRMDSISASLITRPNLTPDVDKWSLQPPFYIENDPWGKSARAINPQNGTYVCSGPRTQCYPGQTYTITGDSLLYAQGGRVWIDVIFVNAAGNWVADGPHRALSTYHDHSVTNANRLAHVVSAIAPPDAVKMFARFVAAELVGCTAVGIRQVKLEQGPMPATAYTQEGELNAVNAAITLEQQARVSNDEALALQVATVSATLNGTIDSAIRTEQQTRAQNDEALALQIQTVSATLNGTIDSVIRTEQQTRAEADQALATQVSVVNAMLNARPNLCVDVDKWTLGPGMSVGEASWGLRAEVYNPGNGISVSYSPKFLVAQNATYTVTGDSLALFPAGGRAEVYFDMLYYRADGVQIGDGGENVIASSHDYDMSGTNRRIHSVQSVAPPGAVQAIARFVGQNLVSVSALGFRQVKVELGGLPATAYSAEGEIVSVNAAIKTEQETRATAVDAVAKQVTTVQASLATRPNMCPDVDRWALGTNMHILTDSWGKHTQVNYPGNGTFVCDSPRMPAAGGARFVVAGDSLMLFGEGGSGYCYFDMIYYNAQGNIVGDGGQVNVYTNHDFDSTGETRKLHAAESIAPADAVECIARFVAEITNCNHLGFRQVKVERGSLPATSYTVEGEAARISASIQQEASVRAQQTGELYAQYTVKTDVGGLISGYGLASTATNAPPTSAFGIRATQFWVTGPTIASPTAPTTGLYRGKPWLNTTDGLTYYLVEYVPGVTHHWLSRSDQNADAIAAAVAPFVIQTEPVVINGVLAPSGVHMKDAFIQNGTITNAKIAHLAVDDAKIANLSVAKLVTGSLAVGQSIYSTSYAPGVSGWVIDGSGTAEFNNITVRGTIYALAGVIGGITVRGDTLTAGSFTGWGWPVGDGGGMALGPNGLLLGNPNTGRYFLARSDGRVEMPGLTVIDGVATFSGSLNVTSGGSGGRQVITNRYTHVYDENGALAVEIGWLP